MQSKLPGKAADLRPVYILAMQYAGLLLQCIPMGSLVWTLNDHLKSEPEPPDLIPSSNIDFPVAWITGPATDPSLIFSLVFVPVSKASEQFFRLRMWLH
jgi:hypothetical protein